MFNSQNVVKEYSYDDQLYTHPITSPFKLKVSGSWVGTHVSKFCF
jgi:hypothetical protein